MKVNKSWVIEDETTGYRYGQLEIEKKRLGRKVFIFFPNLLHTH